MKRYIIRKLKSTKDSISMSSDKINSKITGMYRRMNDIVDRANISGKEIDVKIAIEKLQSLYDEVFNMILTIPKEFNFNTKDVNKLLEQIRDSVKFLKRMFLEDTIKYDNDAVDFTYLLTEERKAVEDYRKAIASTTDKNQLYVLSHILKEETHHIELLENLQKGKVEFNDEINCDKDE